MGGGGPVLALRTDVRNSRNNSLRLHAYAEKAMKTQNTKPQSLDSQASRGTKGALIGLALLVAGAGLFSGVAFGATFNNVQVFVNTAAALPYSYVFTAYNLTGDLVGTYQSSYPAAAFLLPTGDYLFTVSALYQSGSTCYLCMGEASSTAGVPGSTVAYYPLTSEYGYLVQHVDSSQTLNINTQNVTQFPTTQVTAKATYVNGTSASGAYVSASIVGQWYYWWGQDTKILMSAQTGSDGVATLVLPVAPAVVTAWSWVPVNLPANETTIVWNVGGEKVNVTVYWQPTYVGLSGSALLFPPTDSVNLTLHYQQPDYWVMRMGVQTAGGSDTGTYASQPTGVPAQSSIGASQKAASSQYYTPYSIPPIEYQAGSGAANDSTQPFLGLSSADLAISAGILAIAAAGILGVVLRRRTRRLSAP